MNKLLTNVLSVVLTAMIFLSSNFLYWSPNAFASTPKDFASSKLDFIRQEIKNSTSELNIGDKVNGMTTSLSDSLGETVLNVKNTVADLHIGEQTNKLKNALLNIDVKLKTEDVKDLFVVEFTGSKEALKNGVTNLHLKDKINYLNKNLSEQDLLAEAKQLQHSLSSIDMAGEMYKFKKSFSSVDIASKFNKVKDLSSNIHIPKAAKEILSNVSFLKVVEDFLEITPENFCNAYNNYITGVDYTGWQAIEKGAGPTYMVFKALSHASLAGAGNLTGYAGIASTVSQLGLSGVVTPLASLLGSGATGAAATAVVTSAVGGPAIMAALIIGGAVVTDIGVHHAVNFTFETGKKYASQVDTYAQNYCQNISG